METFKTINANESKLYLEVNYNFKDLDRTYVQKEKINTWEKITIQTSLPGSGNISFFEVGRSVDYKDKNRILIVTYFDLQNITDIENFKSNLKINYHLLEDDDAATPFFKSEKYYSDESEMVFSDDNSKMLLTKIIEIK